MTEKAIIPMGLAVVTRLTKIAHANNQVVGEKSDYYVTLEQVEALIADLIQQVPGDGYISSTASTGESCAEGTKPRPIAGGAKAEGHQ